MSRTLSDAWAGIEIGWTDDDPPDDATIENATRLLNLISDRCPPPALASRGYWPTTNLSWGVIAIEIFNDRYELYIFEPKEDYDITHYDSTRPDEVEQMIVRLAGLLRA